MLARGVVGGKDDGRLIAEGDGLEEVTGEQRPCPGALPVLLVMWSMLTSPIASSPCAQGREA
jgi:hypothetical protein